MTPFPTCLQQTLFSPITVQRETSFHFSASAFCRASSFVLHSNSIALLKSHLRMSSLSPIYYFIFISSAAIELTAKVFIIMYYIITNYSISSFSRAHCSSGAANTRFSSFLTTPTFHLHCLYQHGEATASNREKGKQGRRRKKDEQGA